MTWHTEYHPNFEIKRRVVERKKDEEARSWNKGFWYDMIISDGSKLSFWEVGLGVKYEIAWRGIALCVEFNGGPDLVWSW